MILKRDNVEKIVLNESIAKAMLSKGWVDITPEEEKPRKISKKKQEDDK